MGILWWILDPIIFMFIFYLVFGVLMLRGEPGFLAFLLTGLVTFQWFQNTVGAGTNSIQSGQGLMQQVYLPKVIFPLVHILTDLFKFSLIFILLLIFLWLSGHPPGITYLALPLLLLIELALIVSVTCLAAALVPVMPDLSHAVRHSLRMLLFVSGVFFSADIIPEQYQFYFYLNPVATLLASFRDVLLYNAWPNWAALAYVVGLSIVIGALAFYALHRLEFEYPRLVSR